MMQKLILPVFILTLLFSCTREKNKPHTVDKDKFYFLSSCREDTNFISSPSFDTAHLRIIAKKDFTEYRKKNEFAGKVIKLSNDPAPVDGKHVWYVTPELGIIYSKSTTWPCYTRLHSTNDSIEKRINQYIDHILSSTEFVMQGDDTPTVILKTIKFTPQKTE